MGFQRARSDEQRDQRRTAILEVTASMLGEMRVAEVSLNELSRRVGLAKSNVLRYFESREAILLDLLDLELASWIEALEQEPVAKSKLPQRRAGALANLIAGSLKERPVLCDLIHSQSSVLERNVSTDVVLRHKRTALRIVDTLTQIVRRHLPELNRDEAVQIIATAIFMTSAAWPSCQPTPALLAAYERDAEVAAMRLDFTTVLREALDLSMTGLLARKT